MKIADSHSIIVIDSDCLICNRFVEWLAPRDRDDNFRISGLETTTTKSLLLEYGINHTEIGAILLFEAGQVYEASEAVWRIMKKLNGYKYLGSFIRFFPKGFRNRLYYFIARRRYFLFGKANKCSLDEIYVKKIISD